MLQADLGDALGFKWHKIKDIETGKQYLSPDIAHEMEEKYRISFKWLLTGEGAMLGDQPENSGLVSIPLHRAMASAGGGSINEDLGIIDYCKFKADWIRTFRVNYRRLALMPVSGDSMEDTLSDGDVVMFNRNETDPADGKIFIIVSGDYTLTKRIQIRGEEIWLISDNKKKYPPVLLDQQQSRIIGRVVWFGRKLI